MHKNVRRGIVALATLAITTSAFAAPVFAQEQPESEQVSALDAEGLSLEGMTVGVEVIGTDHYWDRMAFEGVQVSWPNSAQKSIAVNASRDDQKQVSDLENLLAQEPDAIVNILGTASVLAPVFAKIAEAGVPLFGIDMQDPSIINNVTSDNHTLGRALAEQMVEDIGGEGNIVVFNGFYGINVCAIRYDELQNVLAENPDVQILQPELQDVIPNTQEDARKKVQDLLQKYPEGEIDAVWACWDIPGLGANLAIVDAGRQEASASTASTATRRSSRSWPRTVRPSGATPPSSPTSSARSVPANIAKYLAGEVLPVTTLVDAYLTTPDNVEEVRATLGLTD